jgi:hypothetical protein
MYYADLPPDFQVPRITCVANCTRLPRSWVAISAFGTQNLNSMAATSK